MRGNQIELAMVKAKVEDEVINHFAIHLIPNDKWMHRKRNQKQKDQANRILFDWNHNGLSNVLWIYLYISSHNLINVRSKHVTACNGRRLSIDLCVVMTLLTLTSVDMPINFFVDFFFHSVHRLTSHISFPSRSRNEMCLLIFVHFHEFPAIESD